MSDIRTVHVALPWLLLLVAGLGYCRGWWPFTRWTGVAYPDRNNLTNNVYVGEFETLEACRNAALAELQRRRAAERGDYECGKNCKPSEYGVSVCVETAR